MQKRLGDRAFCAGLLIGRPCPHQALTRPAQPSTPGRPVAAVPYLRAAERNAHTWPMWRSFTHSVHTTHDLLLWCSLLLCGMRMGKRMVKSLLVLERKLRALGRCFTLLDIQEQHGCAQSTAYKVLRYWEATGHIRPARIVRPAGARKGCLAYEFVDTEPIGMQLT